LYWFGMTEIGVQKGYAPVQPIAYSHKLHAGDLKIDCKYCHSTAEYSKQASIPSLNTCMNCHKGVQKASTAEGDEISVEIKKIYAALDYNPEKNGAEAFGPNPRPIRWTRIHNLPDHAYFNHSQHVKVGKLACQTCHGPVEKMEVVQQWSTLQMGWCINCHLNTGMDVEANNYYKALHQKASADIKANGDKSKYFRADGKVKVTPSMNGGLECSKCHY
jgi:Cytochrome c7 and related cytochrome c